MFKLVLMKRSCVKIHFKGCFIFHLCLQSKSADTKPGGIQLAGEVRLLCLDARRKQRRWLTLSFFAVGLWVWARDRNSLYRHCVCDCWNDSTVERFVHCHQGKSRQQKHTLSGKKKASTWEGLVFSSKCLAWVSAVNNIPFRTPGGKKIMQLYKNVSIIQTRPVVI